MFNHYSYGTDAVIFVVDCSDRLRIPELFQKLCQVSMQTIAIVCVIAENYDLPGSLSVEELNSKLQLKSMNLERSKSKEILKVVYVVLF